MQDFKIDHWIQQLKTGNQRSAAKLISLIENYQLSHEIIPKIHDMTGNAYIIGITGAPGVGKSTLTDKIVKLLISRNKKVGIIAIDPTSPFTGGAILGDRIRLQQLATNPNVFIRSMASRGHLGGVSNATMDAVKVLDALGMDYIFIETVGVGQSEVDIVKHVDTTLLTLIPGMGDEIQALKAGVMEIADVFVINKADREGVERTILEVEMLQHLSNQKDFVPPIQKVIARENKGIEELWAKVETHRKYMEESGTFISNRKKRLQFEIENILLENISAKAKHYIDTEVNYSLLIDKIYSKELELYSQIEKILKELLNY